MKRRFAILLTMCMSLALFAGCGKDDNSSSNEENTDEPVQTENVHLKDYVVEDIVTLGEYTGFEITVAAPSVNEATQEMYVNNIFSSYLTEEMGIKDRAVAEGDNTYISYVGKLDGVEFDGGTSEGTFLEIGSGQYIEGFEEGLVGVMPGETVDLNLTFPENYTNTELAGKAVVFTVTVHYIEPEISDVAVAAMNNSEFSNVEELYEYVYNYLLAQAEYNYDLEIENTIIENVLGNCIFGDLPTGLVNKYTVNAEQNLTNSAEQYGYDLETYALMYYGSDAATLTTQFGTESAKQIIALQAIANKEGIDIDDEELDKRLEEQMEVYGIETLEEFLGQTDKEDWRDYFMATDVINFITENSTVITE